MWKHTEVTRDSVSIFGTCSDGRCSSADLPCFVCQTEEVIGNVKRNAQDKVRRPSRGSDDLSSDDRVARARVAVTMRSNLDSQSSARGTHRKVLGKAALASPVSPAFAHAETWAGKSRWNHLTRGGKRNYEPDSTERPAYSTLTFQAGFRSSLRVVLRILLHGNLLHSRLETASLCYACV